LKHSFPWRSGVSFSPSSRELHPIPQRCHFFFVRVPAHRGIQGPLFFFLSFTAFPACDSVFTNATISLQDFFLLARESISPLHVALPLAHRLIILCCLFSKSLPRSHFFLSRSLCFPRSPFPFNLRIVGLRPVSLIGFAVLSSVVDVSLGRPRLQPLHELNVSHPFGIADFSPTTAIVLPSGRQRSRFLGSGFFLQNLFYLCCFCDL